MRSKILPTLYSIVHGPKKKTENKTFKQKKLNGDLHAKQNHKETSILKFEDTYTHMPKRAYDHKFTKLSYVHTNITKLKLNIRHYYVIKIRATTFFCFCFFFYFFHSMSQSNSQNGKLKNIKNKEDSKSLSLPFAQCVRVLPELSQCSGKLSIGTHDSTQTGSYRKSPLCKKNIACLLHTHTLTHTRTLALYHAQGKLYNQNTAMLQVQ